MRIIYLLLATCIIALPTRAFGQISDDSQPGSRRSWFRELANVRETPIISVEAGIVGLVREKPTSQTLAVDENSNPIFNADELQGSMQFGFQTYIDFYEILPYLGGIDWQIGYFGVNSLDAETTLSAVAVSPIFFNSIPVNPEPTSNIIYSSNLYSAEMSFRFLPRAMIRPIVGLRYFKLEDQYDAFNHGTGNIQRIGGFSNTNNSLFGGQFGAEGDFWLSRYTRVYASGKYGAMNNRVEGAANAADSGGNEVTKYYSTDQFSSFLDAGAGVDMSFAGPLSFRVGYRFIYADALALGVDQNESVRLLSPGETIVFNSQQWHGLDLMAVFAY